MKRPVAIYLAGTRITFLVFFWTTRNMASAFLALTSNNWTLRRDFSLIISNIIANPTSTAISIIDKKLKEKRLVTADAGLMCIVGDGVVET
jgi:DNA-directed RNA polymerase delta subunit